MKEENRRKISKVAFDGLHLLLFFSWIKMDLGYPAKNVHPITHNGSIECVEIVFIKYVSN